MLHTLGFGHIGIRAGSLAATLQSAGVVGVGMTSAATVATSAALLATGAVLYEYTDAQEHTLGPGESEIRDEAKPWILVWENWSHGVFFKSFESKESALACMTGGRKLRRMLVCLTPDDTMVKNEHGNLNPWVEHEFQGMNAFADNTMRRRLRDLL